MSFNGSRLRVARQLHGYTQRDFATLVGLSHPMITQYENGLSIPKSDLVDAFAVVANVKADFFYDSEDVEFDGGALNFRDQRATPERVRNRITAYANFFAMALKEIRQHVEMPALSLPTAAPRTLEEVEETAIMARSFWGIDPDAPIGRMSRVVENAGVALTPIRLDPNEISQIDALSGYHTEGVVLLNVSKDSTCRSRFDMAHELLHGIAHRAGTVKPEKIKED